MLTQHEEMLVDAHAIGDILLTDLTDAGIVAMHERLARLEVNAKLALRSKLTATPLG